MTTNESSVAMYDTFSRYNLVVTIGGGFPIFANIQASYLIYPLKKKNTIFSVKIKHLIHRQEIARRMGFDSREDVEKAIRRLRRDQQDKRKRH